MTNMSLFILSQVSIISGKGCECSLLTALLSVTIAHHQAFYQKTELASLNRWLTLIVAVKKKRGRK